MGADRQRGGRHSLGQIGRELPHDLDGARQCYEEAVKHNPQNFVVLNNLAFLLSDKLGNAAASNPLRVWIQYRGLPGGGPMCPSPPPSAGPPPNCTGSFDRVTGTVSSNPCRGRTFADREILNEGALPEGM